MECAKLLVKRLAKFLIIIQVCGGNINKCEIAHLVMNPAVSPCKPRFDSGSRYVLVRRISFPSRFVFLASFWRYTQRPGGGDVGILTMKWTNAPLVPRFYSQSGFETDS
jgi:hypothetical protein